MPTTLNPFFEKSFRSLELGDSFGWIVFEDFLPRTSIHTKSLIVQLVGPKASILITQHDLSRARIVIPF